MTTPIQEQIKAAGLCIERPRGMLPAFLTELKTPQKPSKQQTCKTNLQKMTESKLSIITKSPQHLFQVRSCPSPRQFLCLSCCRPWSGKAAPSPQHLLILQLSNKQVSSKGPSAPEVAPAQSRDFEARTPLFVWAELPMNTAEEGPAPWKVYP